MSFFSKRNKDKHNDKAAKLQETQPPTANPPMNFGQQVGGAPSGGQAGLPRATSFDRMPALNGGPPSQKPGGRDSPSQMGGPAGFGPSEREMSREQLAHQQAAQEQQRKISGSQQQQQQMQGGVHQARKPVSSLPGPPPPGPSEIQFPWCATSCP
jgi:hypothetical protein